LQLEGFRLLESDFLDIDEDNNFHFINTHFNDKKGNKAASEYKDTDSKFLFKRDMSSNKESFETRRKRIGNGKGKGKESSGVIRQWSSDNGDLAPRESTRGRRGNNAYKTTYNAIPVGMSCLYRNNILL